MKDKLTPLPVRPLTVIDLIWDLVNKILDRMDRRDRERARWSWERGPHDRAIFKSGVTTIPLGDIATPFSIVSRGEIWIEEIGSQDGAVATLDARIEIYAGDSLLGSVPTGPNVLSSAIVKLTVPPGPCSLRIVSAATSQVLWFLRGFERFPETLIEGDDDEDGRGD